MTTIVSVSLPPDVRAVLDEEAKRQRRSRSFVVAEAVRDYVRRQVDAAFSEARERTLREGLELSPAQRVHLSEDLWQELAGGRKPVGPWTASFNTFEEYERSHRDEP